MQRYEQQFKAMGSPCQIQLYAKKATQAKNLINQVISEINRLEKKYSRYLSTSFLTQINQTAGQKAGIEVDSETASLLNYADNCYQQSDQLFDISAGVLNQIWDFKKAQLPSAEAIATQLKKVGWDKISWQAPKLILPIPGMALDFGGIVKEYAVDSASRICLAEGIKHGLIELGGDLRALGGHPNGKAWQVGITHPRKAPKLLTHLQLFSGAIATSGDYERFFKINDKRYCHILNPKTGYPIDTQKLKAISIIADYCVIAGSLASITLLKQTSQWLDEAGVDYIGYQ